MYSAFVPSNGVSERRRKYLTLDAIRGVAAILIVMRHIPTLVGGEVFPESHLAVDLFFGLSGFVIADAYGQRLERGLRFLGFLRIRLVRLYPLYFLALLVGLVVSLASIKSGHGNTDFSLVTLGMAAVEGLLLMPNPLTKLLFPLNGPAWSLFLEIVINLLYAGTFCWLIRARLVVVLIISGAGMIFAGLMVGGLDLGAGWKNIHVAMFRIMFAFSAGLLIQGVKDKFPRAGLPGPVCLALVVTALCAVPPPDYRAIYEVLIAVLFVPAIIFVASRTEPESMGVAKLYAGLGSLSYGIYVLHVPIASLVLGVAKSRFALDLPGHAPISGVLFILGMIAFALLVDRYFDRPVRNLLSGIGRARPLTSADVRLSAESSEAPVAVETSKPIAQRPGS